jgi:uncharacterized membrane protein
MSFLQGMIAMCFALVGLFFLRFWRDTSDRLFLLFALSFWLQALTRAGLSLSGQSDDVATYWYLVRLAAFLLIVVAIAMKNLGSDADD